MEDVIFANGCFFARNQVESSKLSFTRLQFDVMNMFVRIFFFVAITLLTASLQAENWLRFLGPEGNGHIPEKSSPPLKWSETENVTWKIELPGRAWSSPVVWGDRLWLTNAKEDGSEKSILCIDASNGKIVHNRVLLNEEAPQRINAVNSYASPTCALEEGRVYVHFGYAGTFCLDSESGETIWERRDLKCDHEAGPGSSPILYKNLLILHVDGMDEMYVIALNKTNGETVWKTPRSFDFSPVRVDQRKAFSTPLILEIDGKDQLVGIGANAVYGYEPITGKEIWRYDFLGGYSNAAVPVKWKDRLIVNTGFDRAKLLCIPLGKTGVIPESELIWRNDRNISPVPSPVAIKGFLYNGNSNGIASCIDIETGNATWTKRFGGGFWASMLCTNDRVYFFDDAGTTTVIKPDPEKCEIIAENTLDSGCMGTPAVCGKTLYLRTKTHLYRIEEK